jgi:primosomal protein N' (replication factor Y)
VIGAGRTTEELGRAFPGVPVRMVEGDGPGAVSGAAGLVVATPGAEPTVPGGYAAALLLDGNLMLSRADLRAGEETLRRWLNAAALLRPGAPLVLMADPGSRPAQALVRWDPFGFATHELGDREAARFPPAVRLVTLTGPEDAVGDLLGLTTMPVPTEVLGPVALTGAAAPAFRAVLRVPRNQAAALSAALKAAAGVRSARKAGGAVRIQVDPVEIG